MDRMSGIDAGMFFAENETTPLQIASVSVFEGPPPPYGEFMRAVIARWSRGWNRAGGRSSARSITAWSTASAAAT